MDIFQGLKFEPNAEIGENSHLRMDTSSEILAASGARKPCALRLKAHLQKVIPGLHVLTCTKASPQLLS